MKLVIKRNTALTLLKALGFKEVAKWDDKKLARKVKQLPELTDGVKVKNPKIRRILKKIQKASRVILKTGEKSPIKKKKEKVADQQADTPKKKSKKEAKKETGEKSNKQKVYEAYLKVKPANAHKFATKWWKMVNKQVELTTIKNWIGMWKRKKGLPASMKKKRAA